MVGGGDETCGKRAHKENMSKRSIQTQDGVGSRNVSFVPGVRRTLPRRLQDKSQYETILTSH